MSSSEYSSDNENNSSVNTSTEESKSIDSLDNSEDSITEDTISENSEIESEKEEKEEINEDEEDENTKELEDKKKINKREKIVNKRVKISNKYVKISFKNFIKNKYTKIPIEKRVNELNDRLYNKYMKKVENNKEKNIITLVRVNKPGGSFVIPEEEYEDFLELYASIVEDPKYNKIKNKYELFQLNLGERQCEVGPLLLDIDLNYKSLPDNMDRIYNDDLLNKFIEIVNNIIEKYYDLKDYKDKLNALIFEKPTPTKIVKESDIYYKDGVHIYIDLPFKIVDRNFIYQMVLSECIKQHIFDHLPTTNNIESILDDSTLSRNCWMMYGSTKIERDKDKTKPSHIRPPYNLTKSQYVYDLTSIKQLSVRKYKNTKPLEVKNKMGEDYLKQQKRINTLKEEGFIKSQTPNNLLQEQQLNININELYNTEYNFKSEEKETIEWAKSLLKIINIVRASNYNDWLKIGWALCNVHTSLLPIYIEWSKHAPNFNEQECIKNWQNCRGYGNVCNIHTLERYAQLDNPTKYDQLFNDIHSNIIEDAIETCSSGKESLIPYTKYGHKYIAVKQVKNTKPTIYVFKNNLYEIDIDGKNLISDIQNCSSIIKKRKMKFIYDYKKMHSEKNINDEEDRLNNKHNEEVNKINKEKNKRLNELEKEYNKTMNIYNKKIQQTSNNKKITRYEEELNEKLTELDKKKNDIIVENQNQIKILEASLIKNKKELVNSKSTSKKNYNGKLKNYNQAEKDFDNVDNPTKPIARNFIYKIQMGQEEFDNTMNQNSNLIGLKNGIYDLETFEFRKGNPEDYVSLSMGCKYNQDLNWENEDVKFCMDYLNSLQTKKENAEYMIYLLSQFLYGGNKSNKMFFFYGEGCNGKSILINILQKLFHKYYTSASSSILQSKNKGKSSDAKPEIVKLKNKRLIIIQEGEPNLEIQSSFMKLITGGDTISARGLYEEEADIILQGKIIYICNKMPPLDDYTYGTLRRILKINFDKKFIDPKTKRPEDFEVNESPQIENIYKIMVTPKKLEALLWIFIEYYKKYSVIGLKPPKDVLETIEKYKIESNQYLKFLKENYCNDTQNINPNGINLNDIFRKYKS